MHARTRAQEPFIYSRPINRLLLLGSLAAVLPATLHADPVPVHTTQGTLHGFLILKDLDDHPLAIGDIVQVAHGTRVTLRTTYHFRDGSLDDETTVFTQRATFHLISDHHIQRGPSFPHPLDMSIDTATGTVTSIITKDGKSETKHDHMKLPPDLSNGIVMQLMFNLNPKAESRLAMIVPSGKPRLVHLGIKPDGEDPVSIGGQRRTANRYAIKIEIGGVAGVVAPIVGKQPPDIHLWILTGDAPTFVRQESQFFEDGPIWRVEQIVPTSDTPTPHPN